MIVHAYLFEAKSIQEYILAGNRLKILIGGSELVDSLCPDRVNDLCQALQISDRVRFSRNAGGACYLFSDDECAVARFAAAWPLLVQRLAPGLAYAHARGSGNNDREAYKNAHRTLLACTGRIPVELPVAGPPVQFAPRTGRPAVCFNDYSGETEPIDAATRAKLHYADNANLIRRFSDKLCAKRWPVDLTPKTNGNSARAFPYQNDDPLLGVIHADGNGLGQLLMKLRNHVENQPSVSFTDFFFQFSEAISTATATAARWATEEVLLPEDEQSMVPARPIVLGGDDLTMLVRADLALEFARVFLLRFEEATKVAFEKLRERFPTVEFPPKLTACAGITYIRPTHPFQSAYRLAESLCRRAKTLRKGSHGNGDMSAVAFHRITTALVDDWESVRDNELTLIETEDQRLLPTLEAYAVKEAAHLPPLNALRELRDLLASPAVARGPARQLITLLTQDPIQARQRYKRWRDIMEQREPDGRPAKGGNPELLKRFDDLLAQLTGHTDFKELPFAPSRNQPNLKVSPLGDALTLLAVYDQGGCEHKEKQKEAAA